MKKKLWICTLAITMLILTVSIVPVNACWHRRRPIIILRDNYGVPHIYAKTKEGLAYGCGYAMAQDRLWQADVFRRAAFGRLAEIGLATVEDDYETRAVGYSWEELGEIFDNWVPTNPKAKLKEMMLAFVDGINEYITEATVASLNGDYSLMPFEYLALKLTPEPWTIEDSTVIMAMMAWRFGGCGGDELKYAAALTYLQAMYGEEQGLAMFNDHFPQNDLGAEVTIPVSEGVWPDYVYDGCGIELPKSIMQVYQEYNQAQMGQEQLLESLGLPTKFGSNAWMVRPFKSETRNALEVGGPQMGQTIPQIVLEVGLHGAGIDAVGMMMPMSPTILIGVSKYGAWTSTTGVSDVMDTYIEVLNPTNPTQYLHNGEWLNMETRIETIYDAVGNPHEFEIYRTIHGPIIGTDFSVPEHPLAFTMKTPYYKNDLAAEEGWFLFQQAKDIWDFQDACKTIQPAHNFYWIDTKGNIGYWHAGTFPIKPTTGIATEKYSEGRPIDDRFPLWGTGEEEWIGLTGFAEMPKCINPSQGWLANWNNKPITNWPYGESDAGWGEGHRVKRIFQLLSSNDKFSFEDMNLINMDVGYNHIPGMNLLSYLVEAAINNGTISEEVINLLEDWNHHYNNFDDDSTYDDPGLTIFDAWYERIFAEVFDDDIPPASFPPIGPIHREFAQVWPSTIIHVFDGPASKLPLSYDYLNGEDRDTVIVRVLKEALNYLTDTYGSDMSKWLTPVHTTKFDPQGFLNNPLFEQPELRMHSMNRGTYNQIVEMIKRGKKCWGRYPHAVNVIPPGQSGFVNYLGQPSPHAYDQLTLYETWTYKPIRFRFWDILKIAEFFKILFYP